MAVPNQKYKKYGENGKKVSPHPILTKGNRMGKIPSNHLGHFLCLVHAISQHKVAQIVYKLAA